MNEVELSSEFMLLIIKGTLDKTISKIDTIYDDYDTKYPDRDEVARRFRITFDLIDALLTIDQISDLFSNRSVFYALFATIYGWQFGIRAAGEDDYLKLKKEKPKSVTPAMVHQLKRAATDIKKKSITDALAKSLRGATTDAISRRQIIKYLAGNAYDPFAR